MPTLWCMEAEALDEQANERANPRRGADWLDDFDSPEHEWRRLLAEVVGTFLLVLVAAGAAALEVRTGGRIGRPSAVVAPGLTVMALVLALGAVSGMHLNPVVSLAFALRQEFPWRRLPGYLLAQAVGALAAALLLAWLLGSFAELGGSTVGLGLSPLQALAVEAVLTFGLVSVILGTASSAQNVGHLSAVGVGGYIAAAGLWASPMTGASMNPFRSLAPALLSGKAVDAGLQLTVYAAGPLLGALLAVGAARVFRGPGGNAVAAKAAQGTPAR